MFSDEDAESVCSDIIEHIETGKNVYEQVGEEFFSRREWNIMEWALATCSQYYYGDELLLYVLCHVFHRHAMVICKERYWCTFEPDESMDIYAVLDCCDLHFVYLRPGIFAQLWLKKCHIKQRSPPEFPEWTQCESPRNTEDNGSISANTSLINHSLNPTKPVSGDDGDNKGGNKTMKGGNIPTTGTAHLKELAAEVSTPPPTFPTQTPISLKSACLQTMVGCALRPVKPMSLFAECVDYMSWHTEVYYQSSMQLPCSLQIQDKVAELQRISTLPKCEHVTVYHQVKLYDNVKVDSRVQDYLLQQAQTRSYKVVVNKISQDPILQWSAPARETWQDIDPYSSLEEVESSQASETHEDFLLDESVEPMVVVLSTPYVNILNLPVAAQDQ